MGLALILAMLPLVIVGVSATIVGTFKGKER